jgi:hypothetical protein
VSHGGPGQGYEQHRGLLPLERTSAAFRESESRRAVLFREIVEFALRTVTKERPFIHTNGRRLAWITGEKQCGNGS